MLNSNASRTEILSDICADAPFLTHREWYNVTTSDEDDFIEKGSNIMKLQDEIFKELIAESVPVTLFLMNGFQMRGRITACDSSVVVLVTDGKQQVVYKHSISTITPMRALKSASPKD